MSEKARWPHQVRALEQTIARIEAGAKRICVTSPTGGGKTLCMIDLIRWSQSKGMKTALYTNRRLLLDQTNHVLANHGINAGIRASGHPKAYLRDVQLCMAQTEASQVYEMESRELHDAKLVIVDEAHVNKGGVMQTITRDHISAGAVLVGFTATPLDIGHFYDELVQAGCTSELRACGALLPCMTYGPDEPDLKNIKRQASGEYSEGAIRKVIMTHHIFGRVYDSWKKLNPDARPALLFAPGVKESVWFTQQFASKGVRCAHIDGSDVWIDGERYDNSPDAREQILREHERGEIKVISNRFVLREGIDVPWVYHGIFATVFGGLASYLQSGGRLLRNHPSMDHVILQDHGGNWWRHGSLNADRQWELGDTNYLVTEMREDRLRDRKEPEPIVCPKCARIRSSGKVCPGCGHQHSKSMRMVVQHDGTLKPTEARCVKPRRVQTKPDTMTLWKKMYHRAYKAGMTFRQAEGLFAVENWYWPPRTLPLMPKRHQDWWSPIRDVPKEQLT